MTSDTHKGLTEVAASIGGMVQEWYAKSDITPIPYSLIEKRLRRFTASAPVDGEGEYDEQFQKGITYALDLIAHAFGVTEWHIRDGSESVEGDATATLHDILAKAGVWDSEEGKPLLPARTPEPDADVVVVKRSDMEAAYITAVHSQGYPTVNTLRNKLQIWLSAANLLRTPAGRPDREALKNWQTVYDWFVDNFSETNPETGEAFHSDAREAVKALCALYPDAPSEAEAVRTIRVTDLVNLFSMLPPKPVEMNGVPMFYQDPKAAQRLHQIRDYLEAALDRVPPPALYPASPSEAEAVREACANICKAQKEHYDAQRDTCIRKTEEYHFYDQQAAVAARCEADIRALPLPPAPARGEELPTVDEILDENFTGGLGTEEYLAKLRAGQLTAAPRTAQGTMQLFRDHYWDTFERDKDLILKHVESVLALLPATSLSPQAGVDE